MPIVANSSLPSFSRFQRDGGEILNDTSTEKTSRDLHIGLMNMMPDAALEPTERQFLRLIGASEQKVRFFVYPFSPVEIPRGPWAQEHVGKYYFGFNELKETGLDALIVSGSNPVFATLPEENFWSPLCAVLDWANKHVASTLCACLATHAALLYFHGIERQPLEAKRWGVFGHRVRQVHPLLKDVKSHFNVPHSRWNEISSSQMASAGLLVLAEGDDAGVHLATSRDGFRFVFFQGHPEYDNNSLLKEYKRDVMLYATGETNVYPPFPDNYFSPNDQKILERYAAIVRSRRKKGTPLVVEDFPEADLRIENTWINPGKLVFNHWLSGVSKIASFDRKMRYKEGVNPVNLLEDIS